MLLILHEIVQCHWSPCLDRTVSLYSPAVVATQAQAWAANHLCLKGLQQAAVDHLGIAFCWPVAGNFALPKVCFIIVLRISCLRINATIGELQDGAEIHSCIHVKAK